MLALFVFLLPAQTFGQAFPTIDTNKLNQNLDQLNLNLNQVDLDQLNLDPKILNDLKKAEDLASTYKSFSTGNYTTTPWNMPQFDAKIEIQPDASLLVTETITADFSLDDADHHGIYRYIPLNYKDRFGNNLNLRFKLLKVTDEKNNSYKYEESHSGGKVMLKIGDADQTWNVPKTYLIQYKVERVINHFEDHDELYWNVTGNDGQVDILNSKSTVIFPTNVDASKIRYVCYTGFAYSSAKDCEAKLNSDTSAQSVEFTTTNILTPGEGITIIVGFPKNVVTSASDMQKALWFIEDNWGYFLPLLTFLMFFFIWYTRGRDPKALKGTIMPEYEAPDGLSPAEIGTIIDQRVDLQDITSTIIDLAVRGYLIIHEKKTKKFFGETISYEFEKTTPTTSVASKVPKTTVVMVEELKPHEQIVYDGIFRGRTKVELNDLKNEFYTNIPKVQQKIYRTLSSKGYFVGDPKKTRDLFYGIGIAVAILSMAVLGPISQNLSVYLGLLLSAPIIIAFGYFMPKRTQKGADTYVKILGLEEFIKTAERDRLKFYEKENIFEKILPFAVALKLADKWSKACEGLMKTPPSWYTSTDPNFMSHFNTFYFLNSINHLSSNMNSTLASAPRSAAAGGISGFSSGGGFSGGGFGGGGSGGW